MQTMWPQINHEKDTCLQSETETRRQSVTLFDLSWNIFHQLKFFTALSNEEESTLVLICG